MYVEHEVSWGCHWFLGQVHRGSSPQKSFQEVEKKRERLGSVSVNDSMYGVLKSLTNSLINHGLIVRSLVGKSKFSANQLIRR